MIMTDKSISAVVYNYDREFDSRTLEVWFKVVRDYSPGGELIVLTFNEEDTSIDSFLSTHENDGVRIVGIKSSRVPSWINTMKEISKYIEGEYVWVSPGNMYPNGNVISMFSDMLNDHTLILMKQVRIKEPFDYSTQIPRQIGNIYDPPFIEEESFIVQSQAFRETSLITKKDEVPPDFHAMCWKNLVGIEWDYDTRASVFVVEN